MPITDRGDLTTISASDCTSRPIQYVEREYEIIERGDFAGKSSLAVLAGAISYSDAKKLANWLGGHFVSISSEEENTFVFSLINNKRLWWCNSKFNHTSGPWIGLEQLDLDLEPFNGWRWVTGEALEYSAWHETQPDNYMDPNVPDALNERYGQYWMQRRSMGPFWNDASDVPLAISIVVEIEGKA